jgi:hypothetical protein
MMVNFVPKPDDPAVLQAAFPASPVFDNGVVRFQWNPDAFIPVERPAMDLTRQHPMFWICTAQKKAQDGEATIFKNSS